MTDQPLACLVFALASVALVLLSGCAGAPVTPDHRYLLGLTETTPAPAEDTAQRLFIAPLRLAAFLRSDGIVMQTSEVAIHQGRDHLWAEGLATQLRRNLRAALAAKLPGVRVLDDSAPAPSDGRLHRLEVEVNGFHGRYDGMAVVVGRWWLRDDEGRLLDARRFSIERPLAADGYQALVESLAKAWRSVAEKIAPAVAASW